MPNSVLYIYIKYMTCKHIFLYKKLNDQTVLFLTIQFSISQQSPMLSSNVMYNKQFD